MSDVRRVHWELRTSRPLLAGALLFLAAYAWPILQPDLPGWADITCRVVNLVVWVFFAVDLIVRLVLAERRLAFLRSAWIDVITLALPFLRPLRALRAVLALNLIGRRGGSYARGRVVASVIAAAGVVVFVASLAVLEAERGKPGANIQTFGDALWWTATTVMTVGYGDRYPTTNDGRLVAIALMGTGIALLGVVTAALASWFVERLGQAVQLAEAAEEQTGQSVAELAAEIRELRAELRALTSAKTDKV